MDLRRDPLPLLLLTVDDRIRFYLLLDPMPPDLLFRQQPVLPLRILPVRNIIPDDQVLVQVPRIVGHWDQRHIQPETRPIRRIIEDLVLPYLMPLLHIPDMLVYDTLLPTH